MNAFATGRGWRVTTRRSVTRLAFGSALAALLAVAGVTFASIAQANESVPGFEVVSQAALTAPTGVSITLDGWIDVTLSTASAAPAPASTGSAGMLAESGTSPWLALVMVALAVALVADGRVATAFRRR